MRGGETAADPPDCTLSACETEQSLELDSDESSQGLNSTGVMILGGGVLAAIGRPTPGTAWLRGRGVRWSGEAEKL